MTIYSLDFDKWGARTMRNELKVAVDRWPGGDREEQENLHHLLLIFNTICLEINLEEDLDSEHP